MSWTIVRFIKDDTVEAVPTNWIVGSQCFWPLEKVLKAIQTCQSPTDDWKKYNIARFKGATYDDYKIARSKCKTAMDTSDLNSDLESNKRISRKPPRFVSSDSDDSEGIDTMRFPEIPKVSLLKECNQDVFISEELESHNSDRGITVHPIHNLNGVNSGEDKCCCCPLHKTNTVINMLQQIVRNISLLELNFYDIKRLIENSPASNENSFVDVFKDFDLPLNDMESFNKFEFFLSQEDNMKKSILELAKLGGDTPEGFIRRSLQKLLTHALAQEFSWLGLKNKKPLVKTQISSLLIKAAQTNKNTASATTKIIEDCIKKILRRAKERAIAEQKKMNKE